MFIDILNSISCCVLVYFIILSFLYVLILICSIKDIYISFNVFSLSNQDEFFSKVDLPPVTVIIPAFNEENNLFDAIESVFNSANYNNIFVMVVNDGSSDRTLEKLIQKYDLYETNEMVEKKLKVYGTIRNHYRSRKDINIMVIDKENGEKSDALNAGVNACRTSIFITMDADTLVEPNAINTLVWDMITKKNVLAVGGGVYILNGCTYHGGTISQFKMSKNPIAAIQACEYLRSFLFSRSGWNVFGGALCYSGAFTLFDTKSIIDIGGFDYQNIAQDFEIITHLQAHIRDKHIVGSVSYTPAAIAWTTVPETLKEFWYQRIGWQMGSLRSLMLHKKMLCNPKYGVMGFFTYPFFLFGEIGGAVVEFIAYATAIASWYLGLLGAGMITQILILCWGFTACLTFATTLISMLTFNRYRSLSDILWIFLITGIEMCGFRQYSVVCRVYATLKYCFVKRPSGDNITLP